MRKSKSINPGALDHPPAEMMFGFVQGGDRMSHQVQRENPSVMAMASKEKQGRNVEGEVQVLVPVRAGSVDLPGLHRRARFRPVNG